MPSPFPGMNPYFEQAAHWLDFHSEFLSALAVSWPRRSPRSTSSSSKSIFTCTTCRRNHANDWGRPTCHWSSREAVHWRGQISRTGRSPGGGSLPEQDVEKVPFLEVRDRQGRELVTAMSS